jgi:hypothetical protein
MNCNQFLDRMSAWIDGQLEPAERAELEEHLQECAECQNAAETTRDLHGDLVRAFEAPRRAAARAADRVIAALPSPAMPLPSTALAPRPGWAAVAAAMAIGFLMALLVVPSGRSQRAEEDLRMTPGEGSASALPTLVAAPVARLVAATGPEGVEFSDHTRGTWQAITKLPHFQCPSEGSIRTNENARCELMTADGCVVRMNSGTEVVFQSAGCVELKRGEIWCRSNAQTPLEVLPALAGTAAENALPKKASSPWSCVASDATCLMCVTESGEKASVTAASGNVSVKGRDGNMQLAPSETATITRERIDRDQSSDRLLATSWMQPLLIRKGHADRELAERVDDLLAQTGRSPQSESYEAEIRSLGEFAVLPLLQYLESPSAAVDADRRGIAMQIVSDLAPAWAIADLISLLENPDAEVRFLSAAALQRITKQTQGVSGETWRGNRGEWEPALNAWQSWWTRNSNRFPARFDDEPRSLTRW